MRMMMFLLTLALLFGSGALSAHAATVQDDGLILYFSFDNEKGGTVADETGGGNDGTLDKAEITDDEIVYGSGALRCEDAGAGMTVDSFKELEDYQDNSFLFWLQFTDKNSGSWNQIIAKKAPGSDRSPGIWTCNRVTLHIHYRFNPGNQGTHCTGPGGEGDEFDTGKWYHIAGVKDGAQLRFYIDGEEIEEQGVPKDHAQGAEQLYVGKTGYGAALFYLDDLYVYDRALSTDEVIDVMDGNLLPVEPKDKLTTTWGSVKARRD